jgi:hypothetical protein
MRLLNDSLQELVASGSISGVEALAKSVDKDNLRARLQGLGVDLAAPEATAAALPRAQEPASATGPQGASEPPAPLPSEPRRGAPEQPGADSDDPFERFKKLRGR